MQDVGLINIRADSVHKMWVLSKDGSLFQLSDSSYLGYMGFIY